MSLEDTLRSWTAPSSDHEQEKQDRTERMIREAVEAHEPFNGVGLSIYAKGSYANNTNVRTDSDVDIGVECTECVYWKAEDPDSHEAGPPYKGIWTPELLRAELVSALREKFGDQVDVSGSTAIGVNSSTARVDADIVPSFSYRYYWKSGSVRKGTKIFRKAGGSIVNYPRQQLEHGREKNKRTNHWYKKGVRILKRVENAMVADDVFEELPSYLVECLAYNCRDEVFGRSSWVGVTKGMLVQIWEDLEGPEPTDSAKRCLEANKCFYLFHGGQDWDRLQARRFAKAAWNYLDLANE